MNVTQAEQFVTQRNPQMVGSRPHSFWSRMGAVKGRKGALASSGHGDRGPLPALGMAGLNNRLGLDQGCGMSPADGERPQAVGCGVPEPDSDQECRCAVNRSFRSRIREKYVGGGCEKDVGPGSGKRIALCYPFAPKTQPHENRTFLPKICTCRTVHCAVEPVEYRNRGAGGDGGNLLRGT